MEEIINALHKKYGISKAALSAICESPFRFLADEIRSGEFNGINFKGLGKFVVHPAKKNYMLERFDADILKRANRRIDKREEKLKRNEITTDIPDSTRVEQSDSERIRTIESRDSGTSQEEIRDLSQLSNEGE